MDKVIYTAMTGAEHTLSQQANAASNLANASTTGFRSQIDMFRAVPVVGGGSTLPTRTLVVDSTSGTDFTPGSLEQTGRPLDVAVQGSGWLAVQAADGTEAYTRAGDLKIDQNGILQTQAGNSVLSDTGPITVPPETAVTIAGDGTVSTVATDGVPNDVEIIGRIKLVNPDDANMVHGDDGLYRQANGANADVDENVTLAPGFIESSNVNPVESMVTMINLAQQFNLHMKLLTTVDSDESKASAILTL
jgi:flagellar basal-body rod protein FlgF